MSDHSRRAFLGSAGGCLGATMAACVLRPIELRALRFTIVDSTHAGQERAFPIPSCDSVTIDRQSSAIVVRLHGRVFACAPACPHEQAAVKWVTKAARFQCTKHDSIYTPEGAYHSGRATRNLDRFPIRRDGTQVIVRLDQVFRSDLHPAEWTSATVLV